jgi:hypothetical protein
VRTVKSSSTENAPPRTLPLRNRFSGVDHAIDHAVLEIVHPHIVQSGGIPGVTPDLVNHSHRP